MGSVSWERRDTGSIPRQVEWVKDLALLQVWLRLQPRLRSDLWLENSICHRAAKKEKEVIMGQIKDNRLFFPFLALVLLGPHPWHREVPRLGV